MLIPAAVPMAWVFACSNANQGGAAAIGGGVALAMLGTGMRPVTVGFLGWFGPRGLASIVFGILALDALTESGGATDVLARTVGWTVLLSVVAHGLTANPLAARYGRWIEARQRTTDQQMPELEERSELQPSARTTWSRRS